MVRANRFFLTNKIYHITHRCHNKEFHLKFSKDKKNWLHWLFEAKKRFGLSILNYVVTSNHIHLLVWADSQTVISDSMHLIAGATGQAFNNRKKQTGAYWEDRYHATIIADFEHLVSCMAYIDLNMVRAGVVEHPSQYTFGGYHEIRKPKSKFRIIDHEQLRIISNNEILEKFISKVDQIIYNKIKKDENKKEEIWSHSIAIGDPQNLDKILEELGHKAKFKSIEKSSSDQSFVKEDFAPYLDEFSNEYFLNPSFNT